MSRQLTLIGRLDGMRDAPVHIPAPGYRIESSSKTDVSQLGQLYFEAYDPGVAASTLEEAVAEVEASFNGDYGEYWFEASPVVRHEGDLVAALMTVRRAPWSDTPDSPFIIELFTDREHRRVGLARALLAETARVVIEAGKSEVALRVQADNQPAVNLYRSLGFTNWK